MNNPENFNERTHQRLIDTSAWVLSVQCCNRAIFEKAIDIIEANTSPDIIYITDEYGIKLFGNNYDIIYLYNAVREGIRSVNNHIKLTGYHPYINPLLTEFYYPYFKRVPGGYNENSTTYIEEVLKHPDNIHVYLTCCKLQSYTSR
jgi:hypothetical protein